MSSEGNGAHPDLQWLEDKLEKEIDEIYFTDETRFRPFFKVIEILANGAKNGGKDTDVGSNEIAQSTGGKNKELAENNLYTNLKRQMDSCTFVVENLTVEHHATLNNSLKSMGAVAEHYNNTRNNVGRLREQVLECKGLLRNGAQQTDVRELWQRKAQYAQVLRLLDNLDMVRNTPVKFDKLVRQRRFVAAVNLLNASLEAIFSPELVDVPAIASVRDELLQRKGIILDTIVRELADTLFSRTATEYASPNAENIGQSSSRSISKTRGTKKHLRRVNLDLTEDSMPSSQPSTLSFASLNIRICDVSEEAERSMEDPAREFGSYTSLLVEAVRRLRALPDVERHLLERIRTEVDRLCVGNLETCTDSESIDTSSRRLGDIDAHSDSSSDDISKLIRYLRTIFETFVRVLHNHIYFLGLLLTARRRDEEGIAPKVPLQDVEIKCRDDLPAAVWKYMQFHIISVLHRHISITSSSESPSANRKGHHAPAKSLVTLALMRGIITDATAPSRQLSYISNNNNNYRSSELDSPFLLTRPSPLILVHIYRDTVKFSSLVTVLLEGLRKEMQDGKVPSGVSGIALGGHKKNNISFDPTSDLKKFLHDCVQNGLLPTIMQDSNAVYAKIANDPEAFFPFQGEARPVPSNMSFFSTSRNSTSSTTSLTSGIDLMDKAGRYNFRPGRGAEAVAGQATLIFRAMVQVPDFIQEIGSALDITLGNFYTVARDKFQEFCGQGASFKRLMRSGDKLRDFLKRDPQFLSYKRSQHGEKMPFEESTTKIQPSPSRGSSGVPNSAIRRTKQKALDTVNPINEENVEDLFECELMLLEDHWRIGGPPIPRESLIGTRRLQAIACLAFSCDWIVHRILKICVALDKEDEKHRRSLSDSLFPHPPGSSMVSYSQSTPRNLEPLSPSTPRSSSSRLQLVAQKISGLADDCAIILRLEMYMEICHSMAIFASSDLGGSAEDADNCVFELCRTLREIQEALSPLSPKPGVGLVAPRKLFAYAVSPVPRLLPRLVIYSLGSIMTRPVSAIGLGKASKIIAALQQITTDVTETSHKYLVGKDSLAQSIVDRFSRAARYTSLMGATHVELECYIRSNRTDFSKEELRAQWNLQGPSRRANHRDQGGPFEAWWASERF